MLDFDSFLGSVDAPAPLADVLRDRRRRLAQHFAGPALLWSGSAPSRNFAANRYPFRASSHFLYFAGLGIERAVIGLEGDCLTLFWDEPPAGSDLWHGPEPSRDELAAQMGAAVAYPLAELTQWRQTATVALAGATRLEQEAQLGRSLADPAQTSGPDRALVEAIVAVRLSHDPAALGELRRAGAVAMAAHRAGLAARVSSEAGVRAAIEAVFCAQGCLPAYNSIVTTRGEVLHNERSPHPLQAGDLLLVDAGAETAGGWASDITRTWPVSGQWSPSQAEVYDVVLAAHQAAVAAVRPGVEYREIHLLAARTIAAGLVELGILRGDPDSLVERDAHALFFPHGVGHLLGLDVHDMEDLGDVAGYATGRSRSDRFGLGFLRLDRPLAENMVVTIEPGFYQVPALLHDPERRDRYHDCVNWERLAAFADVRGIRIEDDVWVTETGAEVLTAALPVERGAIAALREAA